MSFRFRPSRACLILCFLSCAVLVCEAATFENGTSYILSDDAGTIEILDPTTGDQVAQGSASDGAGDGMDLSTLLWMVFSFLLGVPSLAMGVRLGRFTSGVGLGLGLSVSLWASVINTVSEGNIPDLVILVITVVLFLVGFIVGAITIEFRVGEAALGVAGFMSIMMRVVLMKEDLLVPVYYVNWILCGLFGGIGLILIVCNERWGVIIGSCAAGSFLVCLGIDLMINKQSGMSRGLRFLFDRKKHHLADILGAGYKPLMITRILMIVSIALIPLFALIQHKLFPQPFRKQRHRPASLLGDDVSVRSRTWIGRFRGRTHSAPVSANEVDESTTTQRLVASSEEEPTLQTPSSYRDETKEETLAAVGVPTLKCTQH